MPKELFVTLKKSDNKYLSYPCKGWLELFEIGSSGSLICGVWRGLQADGSAACPVEVRNVEFEYTGGQFKTNKSVDVLTGTHGTPTEMSINSVNLAMKAAFEAQYSRDWNDPAGDDMKAIWTAAWHVCASGKAQSTTRILLALDGMDRGCTVPGFRGHQNGYGEDAGDELQAAREELGALVGHAATVEPPRL